MRSTRDVVESLSALEANTYDALEANTYDAL